MLSVIQELDTEIIICNDIARHKLLRCFNFPIAKSSDGNPLVQNKYHNVVALTDSVSIMRPSVWGNPYAIFSEDSNEERYTQRERVVAKYIITLLCNKESVVVFNKDLRGKRLICCCYPKLCHGNILVLLANNRTSFMRGFKSLCEYLLAQKNSGNPVVSDKLMLKLTASYNHTKNVLVPVLHSVN